MALFITRPKHRFITNPSIIHLFSTSSENDNGSQSPPSQEEEEEQQQQEKQTSFSSYFSDVKASLKQQQQQQRNPQSQHQPNLPPLRKPNDINPSMSKPTSKISSLEEIRRNLADFRIRSSAHFPTPSSSSNTIPLSNQQQPKQPISFHELFKRNKAAESENDNSGAGGNEPNKTGTLSFAAIRETMRQMRPNANTDRNSNANASRSGAASLLGFSNSLKLGKDGVIGGTDGLSKLEQGNVPGGLGMEFVRVYSYEELGQMLRSLRPEVKEGEKVCFSVEELSERLRKLRAMEEREAESRTGTMPFKEIRESLFKLKDDGEKARKAPIQIHRLNLLSTTPEFMMHPPKEHLVEKYFHPDNMSSAEKMKIELSKVREEFKMSESDCGSARVQVAQLTTKIKHLSSVLHKKDKHSRKGLQEMVQKRKKLLKYLRRTDWDSYCFVLSKLGLRDNPDFKYLARN